MFKRRKTSEKINEKTREKIEYYMVKTKTSYEIALNQLIEKGYNYWLLEQKYGEKNKRSRNMGSNKKNIQN